MLTPDLNHPHTCYILMNQSESECIAGSDDGGKFPVVMDDGVDPQIKRLVLGAELRRLRDMAGISGRELADLIGISQSKVSRIEAGAAMPSSVQVAKWAVAVSAPEDARQVLDSLVQAAFTEVQTWRTALHTRPHLQRDIQKLEQSTRRIFTYQPALVPGLLQTAEYAKRVLTLFQPGHPEGKIANVLAARLDRQLILYDESKEFEFLITEAALRWRPGPPRLLLAQLDRIASLSTLENVSVGLIPLSAQAVASMTHAFVMFETDDPETAHDGAAREEGEDEERDTVVTVETVHANLVVKGDESVGLYRTRWSLLRQMAVFDDEARVFLSEVADTIRAGR
ncbi:helix-turn-helix domain-containing protein [Nonomuraea insulae]|uniref:Helix-turn-helix domain-containing protein n=1 Tax=Nonomuraea insulae TaxID=1616787 RepID=A0ABW1CS79_9ACTN